MSARISSRDAGAPMGHRSLCAHLGTELNKAENRQDGGRDRFTVRALCGRRKPITDSMDFFGCSGDEAYVSFAPVGG